MTLFMVGLSMLCVLPLAGVFLPELVLALLSLPRLIGLVAIVPATSAIKSFRSEVTSFAIT